jgi:hypothetical protein
MHHYFLLVAGDREVAGVVSPGADGGSDFLEEGLGGGWFEAKVGSDFEVEVEVEGVVGFGDVKA